MTTHRGAPHLGSRSGWRSLGLLSAQPPRSGARPPEGRQAVMKQADTVQREDAIFEHPRMGLD